jgi:hypothetical protein
MSINNGLTSTDIQLSKKYREMVGYGSIVNSQNDLEFNKNVIFENQVYVDKFLILNNSLNVSNSINIVDGDNHQINVLKSDEIIIDNTSNINIPNITTQVLNVQNINILNDCTINSKTITINSIIAGPEDTDSIINVDGNIHIKEELNINKFEKFNNENDFFIISDKIYLGSPTSVINFRGELLNISSTNINSKSKKILFNAEDNYDTGIEILSNVGEAFIKTNMTSDKFIIKTPLNAEERIVLMLDQDNNFSTDCVSVTFHDLITVESNMTITNNMIFSNDVNIIGNFDVSQTTSFASDTTINSTNVFIEDLESTNKMIMKDSNVLNISGSSSLREGTLDINGNNIKFEKEFIIDSHILNINSNFIYNGSTTTYSAVNTRFKNNINVIDHSVINNDITINKSIQCNGITNKNNLTIENKLTSNDMVTDTLNVNNNCTIDSIRTNMNSDIYSDIYMNGTVIMPYLREFQTNSEASETVPLWGFYRLGGIVKLRLDVIPPIIDFTENPSRINVGENYSENNITVTDNIDDYVIYPYLEDILIENTDTSLGIITDRIRINGSTTIPNTNTLVVGTYDLLYYAEDIIGNVTRSIKKLQVI